MEFTAPTSTSVTVALSVILLTVIYYFLKNRNVLPGPVGLPYLGLYFSLSDQNIHLKLDEYKKKYGDLFSFTYSGKLFINMGSAKALRELHLNNSNSFSQRFTDYHIFTQMIGNGVVMSNGEAWKVLRKFFLQKFRDRGLNSIRDEMAGPVYDSLDATVEELRALRGKPANIVDMLTLRCAVVMRRVIFGEKGITDEELLSISTNYSETLEGMTGVNTLLMGHFARLLFTIIPKNRRSLQKSHATREVMSSCVKKIKHSMNEKEEPSCIIEDFYKERDQRKQNSDPTWKYFTDEALIDSALQFVGDGVMGVAGFIGWFLNTLRTYPDEQKRLHDELVEVVGPNRQPTFEDKANLPYVNAFMNEVLRESFFVHIFPSLECTKETIIRGYRIPKGSITLLNFWSTHRDPDSYEDPDKFDPSRYMTAPGKPKPELPITFGIGKRSCSGENFVMTQLFLFLTTLVKNFEIVSSNDPSNESIDFFLSGKLEIILQPRTEN